MSYYFKRQSANEHGNEKKRGTSCTVVEKVRQEKREKFQSKCYEGSEKQFA